MNEYVIKMQKNERKNHEMIDKVKISDIIKRKEEKNL